MKVFCRQPEPELRAGTFGESICPMAEATEQAHCEAAAAELERGHGGIISWCVFCVNGKVSETGLHPTWPLKACLTHANAHLTANNLGTKLGHEQFCQTSGFGEDLGEDSAPDR
ncbi:MAG TPA: hypothetical protein PLA50_03920, partial [Bacteroidia bacterium]|nr:hypothetical protein [Bacteroidia bacterium]